MIAALSAADEAKRVKALHAYRILDSPSDDAFDAITRAVALVCGVPISAVSLIDRDRLWLLSAQGLGEIREMPREFAPCAQTIAGRDIFEVADARSDPRFRKSPPVAGEPGVRLYAGAPLIDSAGNPLGALCIMDTAPGTLTPEQRRTLTDLATVVVRLIEARKSRSEAVEDLMASEACNRVIAEHLQQAQRVARLGSWEHDISTDEITWSDQVYEIFGLDRQTDRPTVALLRSMVRPDDQLRLEGLIEKAIENRETHYATEIGIRKPTGAERQLLATAELTWENGDLIRHVGTLQDVTEQSAVVRELRRSEQSLAETERRARIGNWEMDVATRTLRWSAGFYALLGLDPLMHAPDVQLFVSLIHPDDRPAIAPYLEGDPAEGGARQFGSFRIIRPDGVERHIEAERIVINNADVRASRVLGTLRDITEERVYLDRLRRSEEFLKRAQEIGNLGSFERIGQDGEVTWSIQLFKILGLDPEKDRPSAELFHSVVHKEDNARLERAFADAAANRNTRWSETYRIVRPDGTERVVHDVSELVWGHDGQLVRQYGVIQDVTEQMAFAEKLRHSEQTLANAQRIAHVGSWQWSAKTGVTSWSAETCRICGIEVTEHAPDETGALRYIHPDDRDYAVGEFQAAMRGERPYDFYHRIVRPDGEVRILHAQGEMTFAADGRPLQLDATAHDVTEQRQIAEDLERTQRMLLDAERIAKIGSWEIDLATRQTRWSAGMYALRGIEPQNDPPDIGSWKSFIHPGDLPRVAPLVDAMVAGDLEPRAVDYRIIRPDGAERTIHAQMTHFIRAQGSGVVRVVGANQDVTEARAAEMALKSALASAESANRVKSEFLANMSHELRTPLNAIIGFSELLTSRVVAPALADNHRGYAQIIHDSGQHLLSIINDILDFSRVDAEHATLRTDWIDAAALLEWVAKLLERKAAEKNLQLVLDVAPEAARFRGDLRLLRQALLNLLSNAVKFTLKGEVRLQVARDSGGDILISVADTGIGMRPDDIPTALTPFLQLENPLQRNYDGIGLGLPLAKRFVELHGGTFTVTSELDRGTTIDIRLPQDQAPAPG